MKKVIRLTESDLHSIIKNTVKRVLNEKKRKKEAPGDNTPADNWVRDYHDAGASWPEGYGKDPYEYEIYRPMDDDYDYCGDDTENERVCDHNRRYDKILSTKKGQMKADWDDIDDASIRRIGPHSDYSSYINDEAPMKQSLDVASSRNFNKDWTPKQTKLGRNHMKQWVNHRSDLDDVSLDWDWLKNDPY